MTENRVPLNDDGSVETPTEYRTKQLMRGLAMLVGVAAGIVVIYFMLSLSRERLRMVLVGEYAQAKVIRVEEDRRRSRKRSYTSYSVLVRHEGGVSKVWSESPVAIGATVTIIYDPTKPTRAELTDGSYSVIGGSGTGIMEVAAYLFGLFLVIRSGIGAAMHFRRAYRGRA